MVNAANIGAQAANFVATNKSGLGAAGVFLVVCVLILYNVYVFLYPTDVPGHTVFLLDEADAREPIALTNNLVPSIYTGGDFTLSFWIFIDDWNYKVTSSKLLFALSPIQLTGATRSPLVGVLTPLQNGLMVRGNTSSPGGGPAPSPGSVSGSGSGSGPDITVESNLQSALTQQGPGPVNPFVMDINTPCDINTVPLQRWVNVTVVSSGRVLDVYMDGKLSRSCVLENVLTVPRQKLQLRLGEFGGVYSRVQMWNVQITPDVIYRIYQQGPRPSSHSFITWFAQLFNINVTFTGPHDAGNAHSGGGGGKKGGKKGGGCKESPDGASMWTGVNQKSGAAEHKLDSYL